jgi:hypothetical protein
MLKIPMDILFASFEIGLGVKFTIKSPYKIKLKYSNVIINYTTKYCNSRYYYKFVLKKIKSGEGARSFFWGAESGARSHGQTGAKSESSLYFLAKSAERERALFSRACANTVEK